MALNTMISNRMLDAYSVDMRKLDTTSGSFQDIVGDCSQVSIDLANEIQNKFPLVTWLLQTNLANRIRSDIATGGMCVLAKDSTGKFVINTPQSLNSVTPKSSSSECCWSPMEFAKCADQVPVNLLCLKDCTSVLNDLVYDTLKIGKTVSPLSSENQTINVVRQNIARLSMAWYTAYTSVLGLKDTYTDILKPFNGLMQIMEDTRVAKIDATNGILQAFDSLYCRMRVLGIPMDSIVIAVNPVIYAAIQSLIVPGQWNRLPFGWTRTDDGEISFYGIKFLQDKLVPVDMENSKGEAWVLTSDSVGEFLGGQLMPAIGSKFVRDGAYAETTVADGCGNDCTYYFNYGAVCANNMNHLVNITNIAITDTCVSATSDLGALVHPETLIPTIGA